jgi:hypothetical protein
MDRPTISLDDDLARRLQTALTTGHEGLFRVLQDPAPDVLRTALKNRALGEDHLLALLKRRDLSEDLLKAVHGLPQTGKSHRLKVALAKNPGTPGPVVLALLPHLRLFELLDLCILPGPTPDQRLAAERVIQQRLPTTELGQKLALARRAPPNIVAALLQEGKPRVVELCLASPRLKEAAILQFVNGPAPTAETISIVARHPKWKNRPNVRLAILKNRKTPAIWFTLFLPTLRTSELNVLAAGRRLLASQKKLVAAELQKRGPA